MSVFIRQKEIVLLSVLALFSVLAFTAEVPGGEQAAKVQTICPVMGGEINKDLYIDVQGKRIYVCCSGCLGEIKTAPEAALKKIAENGEIAQDIPQEKSSAIK